MQGFWKFLVRRSGWRIEGQLPDVPKFLLVVVPHTSNWDFVVGMMLIRSLGLKPIIFAKDVFFFWPLGVICRAIGVYPVNRRVSTNFVDRVIEIFAEHEQFIAAITPEGTRGHVSELKSGYYHIAKKGNIPIVVGGIDFKRKVAVVEEPRKALDNFTDDAESLIAFAKTIHGKHPEYSVAYQPEDN